MKVYCDADGLMKITADKNLGLIDLAKLTGMSPITIRKIFAGKPVFLSSANKLFNALGKDPRLKIWYDTPDIGGTINDSH